jgi:transcription antitermination factor NusG
MVYTKPKWEKKVSAALTKRKIENFLPFNRKQVTYLRKVKTEQEALFPSYVFVNTTETEICKLKFIEGIVSLIFWKGKPAIIPAEEIELIKDFTTQHQNIALEKTKVNVNEVASAIDGSRYSMTGNVLTIKNTVMKVNLPSIGFTLTAKVDTENSQPRTISFGEKDLMLQS